MFFRWSQELLCCFAQSFRFPAVSRMASNEEMLLNIAELCSLCSTKVLYR